MLDLRRYSSLATLIVPLLACSSAQDKPAQSAAPGASAKQGEAKAASPEALLAREAQGLTAHRFDQDDIHAEIPSSGPPTLGNDGGVPRVSIPIGTEAAIHCFIYPQDADPGGTLYSIVENLKRQFSVKALGLGPVEVVREAPVTKLELAYVAEHDKLVGQIKLAFHARIGGTSMCMHDEVGYEKTFGQVYQSFFASLEQRAAPFKPAYVEVVATELNGAPAGYERSFVIDDQGKRRLLSTGLVFGLRSATELVTQDYSSSVIVDGSQRIEAGRWVESRNGKLALDVELTHLGGPRYAYRGGRMGKALKGELSVKDEKGLPSSLWTQNELKQRLAAGGAFSFSIEQYRPSENPGAALLMEFIHNADDPPHTVRTRVSGVDAISTVDEQGREQRSEINDSGMKLVLERVFPR